MNTNKRTARVVGALFITATAAPLVGTVAFIDPILNAPDFLIGVSANEDRVLIGVLLELITAAAVAGTGIALFPAFRRHNEGLALGYAGGRILEGVTILVAAIGALLLLTLSREYVAGIQDASSFQTSSTLLLAVRDWSLLVGPLLFLGPNSLMLNSMFYRSRLVPRFLSVWGLIAAPLVFTAGSLRLFGVITLFSPISGLLVLPIALYEQTLAIWLIVKGFNPSTSASETGKIDMSEAAAIPG